ncbi:retinol-binding protein pinta-like isoform X2 [Musca autumnalis]|uniref:retinol-binding protein pinta-like isoform X2 n=1 Tax=Musca autumnalis TaxID=221902 RepID=UPI003CF33AAF
MYVLKLFEVSSRIPEDLQTFKSWIEQQPHMKARMDDQFLIQFLRGCKYSLERAKEKIDHYYTIRTKYTDKLAIFDVNNERFRQSTRLGCFTPLPTPLNDNGCRLVMYHFNYDPNEFTPTEVFHPAVAMYDYLMIDDPHACICGTSLILDMSKATMSHILGIDFPLLKIMLTYLEKSLPMRVKALYFVNIPSVANNFLKMFLALLSDKLRKRVFVCSSVDELLQYIPLKYLPKYYGGENGSMEEHIQSMEAKFDEYRNYFKENANYGVDETLRQGEHTNGDEQAFGMGGSFRKLQVD